MSNSESLRTTTIKLFRTGDHDCSYLPDRQSRTLFLDPELNYDTRLYEELTQSGFRRSGRHLYRPDCRGCQSCISARIPVNDFKMTRRFRRVLKKTDHLRLEIAPATFRDEDYALFERYINERHSDGDMYPASKISYQDFLATETPFSWHLRYFDQDRLIAVAVTDQLHSGLSAIYTFFEPDIDYLSPGVFSILRQLELCEQRNLPYLYLGYWVPGCQKMQYKTDYRPIELLVDGRWQRLVTRD
ncbi:arginyltransferase [Reinekea blandensis]|uniref:Aspartate/glutamate leucyltransferase n=1 Tax=Reinekea blandensis MED297 TaxID=314283 RepID=A4BDQ2_9GAMM|nr:arginyltransferase [Reinekea blandensis]EAR09661.1 arginyl-tRNA-protein transferase [Reinekea blandensis MED297]